MDVAFVVDKTRSIGVVNFVLLKGFLLQLVGAMHISPDTTHAGVITFNRKATLLSTLADKNKYSNEASIITFSVYPSLLVCVPSLTKH